LKEVTPYRARTAAENAAAFFGWGNNPLLQGNPIATLYERLDFQVSLGGNQISNFHSLIVEALRRYGNNLLLRVFSRVLTRGEGVTERSSMYLTFGQRRAKSVWQLMEVYIRT
jgi:hypothetical protein